MKVDVNNTQTGGEVKTETTGKLGSGLESADDVNVEKDKNKEDIKPIKRKPSPAPFKLPEMVEEDINAEHEEDFVINPEIDRHSQETELKKEIAVSEQEKLLKEQGYDGETSTPLEPKGFGEVLAEIYGDDQQETETGEPTGESKKTETGEQTGQSEETETGEPKNVEGEQTGQQRDYVGVSYKQKPLIFKNSEINSDISVGWKQLNPLYNEDKEAEEMYGLDIYESEQYDNNPFKSLKLNKEIVVDDLEHTSLKANYELLNQEVKILDDAIKNKDYQTLKSIYNGYDYETEDELLNMAKSDYDAFKNKLSDYELKLKEYEKELSEESQTPKKFQTTYSKEVNALAEQIREDYINLLETDFKDEEAYNKFIEKERQLVESAGDYYGGDVDKKKLMKDLSLAKEKLFLEYKNIKEEKEAITNPKLLLNPNGYFKFSKIRDEKTSKLVSDFNNSFDKKINETREYLDNLTNEEQNRLQVELTSKYEEITSKYENDINKIISSNQQAFELTKQYRQKIKEINDPELRAKLEEEYVGQMEQLSPEFKEVRDKIEKEFSIYEKRAKILAQRKISRESAKHTLKLKQDYYNGVRKLINENYYLHINDDYNVREHINNFKHSKEYIYGDYPTKKKIITQNWSKFKYNILNDAQAGIKRMPKNEEEAKKPYSEWTAVHKLNGQEKQKYIKEVRKRISPAAEKEYYLYALEEEMSNDNNVYYLKSRAEDALNYVNELLEEKKKEQTAAATKRIKEGRIDNRINTYNESITSIFQTGTADLRRTKEMLEEIIRHPESDEGFWSGFTNLNAQDYIPFLSGFSDIVTNVRLYKTANKVKNGEPLRMTEKLMLEAFSNSNKINQIKPKDIWFEAGEITGKAIPFLFEFAMTGGISSATQKSVKKGVEIGLKKIVKEGVEDITEKALYKKGTQALAYVVGTAAHTTVNPQMHVKNFTERIIPEVSLMITGNGEQLINVVDRDESFGEAFAKAFGSSYIEIFSEGMFAGNIEKASKFLVNKPIEYLAKRASVGKWMHIKGYATIDDALTNIVKNNMKWNGILEEIAEEIGGDQLQNLFIEGKGIGIDEDEVKKIAISTIALGGAFGALTSISTAATSKGNVKLNAKYSSDGKDINISSEIGRPEYEKFKKLLKDKNPSFEKIDAFLKNASIDETAQDILLQAYYNYHGEKIIDKKAEEKTESASKTKTGTKPEIETETTPLIDKKPEIASKTETTPKIAPTPETETETETKPETETEKETETETETKPETEVDNETKELLDKAKKVKENIDEEIEKDKNPTNVKVSETKEEDVVSKDVNEEINELNEKEVGENEVNKVTEKDIKLKKSEKGVYTFEKDGHKYTVSKKGKEYSLDKNGENIGKFRRLKDVKASIAEKVNKDIESGNINTGNINVETNKVVEVKPTVDLKRENETTKPETETKTDNKKSSIEKAEEMLNKRKDKENKKEDEEPVERKYDVKLKKEFDNKVKEIENKIENSRDVEELKKTSDELNKLEKEYPNTGLFSNSIIKLKGIKSKLSNKIHTIQVANNSMTLDEKDTKSGKKSGSSIKLTRVGDGKYKYKDFEIEKEGKFFNLKRGGKGYGKMQRLSDVRNKISEIEGEESPNKPQKETKKEVKKETKKEAKNISSTEEFKKDIKGHIKKMLDWINSDISEILGRDIKDFTFTKDGDAVLIILKKMKDNGDITEEEYKRYEKDIKSAINKFKAIKNPNLDFDLQYSNSGRLTALMNDIVKRLTKSFPNINVHTTPTSWNFIVDSLGIDENAAGVFYNGEVYLNPNKADGTTPIEEFAHLWVLIAKNTMPSVLNKGRQFISNSKKYLDMAREQFEKMGIEYTDEMLYDEALAKAIADKGIEIIENEKRNAFLNFVKSLFKRIKSFLRINDKIDLYGISMDEYLSKVAKELLNEVPISKVSSETLDDIVKGRTNGKFVVDKGILAENNVWDKIGGWAGYYFNKRYFVSKRFQERIDKANNRIKYWNKRGEYVVEDFQKALTDITNQRGFKEEEVEALLKDVNDFLRGEVDINKISTDYGLSIAEKAQNMRDLIDEIQRDLVEVYGMSSTNVNLKAKISESIGLWVHRSYMMYDVSDYVENFEKYHTKEEMEEIRGAVLNKIKNEKKVSKITWKEFEGKKYVTITNMYGLKYTYVLNDGNIDNTRNIFGENDNFISEFESKKEGEILFSRAKNQNIVDFNDVEIDNASYLVNQYIAMTIKEYKNVANDEIVNPFISERRNVMPKEAKDLLKKRKNIDDLNRLIMGEYLDPRINFMKSVTKASKLLERSRLEISLLKEGEGIFISKKQEIDKNINVEITPDKSMFLKGYYTTKELYDLLYGRNDKITKLLEADGLIISNALIKASLTIAADDSQARNFWGALLNLMATGHLPMGLISEYSKFRQEYDGLDKSAEFIFATPLFVVGLIDKATPTEVDEKKLREQYLELVEMGLVDESASGIKEIADAVVKIRRQIKSGESNLYENMSNSVKKSASDALSSMSKIYQTTDLIFKSLQYEKEKSQFEKIYSKQLENGTMTIEDIKKMAAERTLRSQPTYSRSPEFVKALNKVPVIAPFILFTWQMYQTRYNMLGDILRDINTLSNNKDIDKKEMAKSISKRIAGITFSIIFSNVVASISKYIFGVTDDEEEAFRKAQSEYTENATFVFLNKDFEKESTINLTYIDPMSVFLNPFRAAMRSKDPMKFITESAEPFVTPEILIKRITEAASGRNAWGSDIYSITDKEFEKFLKGIAYTAEGFIPKIYYSGENIYYGFLNKEEEWGRKYVVYNEVLNSRLGVRIKEANAIKSLNYKIAFKYREINKARNEYMRRLKSDDYTDKDYEVYNKFIRDKQKEIIEYYKAIKILKKQDFDFKRFLKQRVYDDVQKGIKEKRKIMPEDLATQIVLNMVMDMDKNTGKIKRIKVNKY